MARPTPVRLKQWSGLHQSDSKNGQAYTSQVNDLENRKTGDSNNGQAYTSQTQTMVRPTPVRLKQWPGLHQSDSNNGQAYTSQTQTMARPTPVRLKQWPELHQSDSNNGQAYTSQANDLENRKTGDSNNGQAYTSQTQAMVRPTPVRLKQWLHLHQSGQWP